jgi:PIN domain nuclease of toxin-antitoxin system
VKLLLDTHVLLWAAADSRSLPAAARALIQDADNEMFFSAASLWEVVIKSALGRTDFKVNARVLRRGLLDNDYIEMPILSEHVVGVDTLPAIHKDPFDRILISQAQVEGMVLLTADPTVARYPGPIQAV